MLIEVNTNAGGIAAAMWAARHVNVCCADWEHATLEKRLLALFQRNLVGDAPSHTGVVAMVDDNLASQPLLPKCAHSPTCCVDGFDGSRSRCSGTGYRDGRLRRGEVAIDRIYGEVRIS